jgi:hypothetical protein
MLSSDPAGIIIGRKLQEEERIDKIFIHIRDAVCIMLLVS